MEATEIEPRCRRCGSCHIRWERRGHMQSERYLGVCTSCGWLRAYDPHHPDGDPHDPLADFLLDRSSTLPASRTPWERLIHASASDPWFVSWELTRDPCPHCTAQSMMSARRLPVHAMVAMVCTACGWTRTIHLLAPASRRIIEEGGDWTPPRGAVKALRRAAFPPGYTNDWSLPEESE